jgi:glycosyltransferase involved in cell wall biosynthesis
MRDGNYAVVHVNNTFPYQAATVIAARLSGIPVVAHVRNPVDALAFNRMLMRLIHTIVPVAACYERQLESWNTGARIRTCHDGVEVACPDAAKAAEVRQRLFGAGDTILVGSVGRLTPQKDYHTFVRSARIVADTRPGVRFAVCGDGPDRESLQHLIHQLGLNDKFTLCGFLNPSEAINFTASLDLFVSSSAWEGLPIAVIEALAVRTPVVATDVGGTSELVIQGKTGDLVPPRNPQMLAAAILSVLSRPRRDTDAARNLALRISDAAAAAHSLDAILHEAATRPSSSMV